jgi:pimeloyl-ACP methyl ester carboxylesterase
MTVATTINVSEGKQARQIACLTRNGDSPGLFWLGGFRSDMVGSKAQAIDTLGEKLGLSVTRFDYSGHGRSSGDFLDGSISVWLEDAQAVFASTIGPQILIGSSMGGWLALLLNKALQEQNQDRVKAITMIAPAIDMTEDLMRSTLTPAELHDLNVKGRVERPSQYSQEPDVLTRKLISDGRQHLLFDRGSIVTGCPVHILQGGQDVDVPPSHAQKLLSHLTQDPVTFSLIPDGDHRLSRAEDLAKLAEMVTRLATL